MKKTSTVSELLAKFSNKYGQTQPTQHTYHVYEMGPGQEVGQEIGTLTGPVSGDTQMWDYVASQAANKFFGVPDAERMAGTTSGPFSVKTPQGYKHFYME